MGKRLRDKMQSLDLLKVNWRDMIRVDVSEHIPRDNPTLEARRKRYRCIY